jgi:hypothetical protein
MLPGLTPHCICCLRYSYWIEGAEAVGAAVVAGPRRKRSGGTATRRLRTIVQSSDEIARLLPKATDFGFENQMAGWGHSSPTASAWACTRGRACPR